MTYSTEGDPATAKILIITDGPSKQDVLRNEMFTGPAGSIFTECLQLAGVIRSDCAFMSVFTCEVIRPYVKEQKNEKLLSADKKFLWSRKGFSAEGSIYRKHLLDKIEQSKATVIIPLGVCALQAICQRSDIGKIRGSVIRSPVDRISDRRIIPTYNPIGCLRGNYLWRYQIVNDIKKGKRLVPKANINHPDYQMHLLHNANDSVIRSYNSNGDYVEEPCSYWAVLEAWHASVMEHKNSGKPLACDIEVTGIQTSLVGFGYLDGNPDLAISIGFGGLTEDQELRVWLMLADILQDPSIDMIFQNGMFDRSFLLRQNKILVRGYCYDTMYLHHLIYPDFLKGLGFLTSLYTWQPYHKDMVKHSTGQIEKENG